MSYLDNEVVRPPRGTRGPHEPSQNCRVGKYSAEWVWSEGRGRSESGAVQPMFFLTSSRRVGRGISEVFVSSGVSTSVRPRPRPQCGPPRRDPDRGENRSLSPVLPLSAGVALDGNRDQGEQ